MNKYRAKPLFIDGIRFASTKEGKFYSELKLLQRAGEIKYFLMQIPFRLPGSTKYLCDFQIFNNDGSIRYVDIKGCCTQVFIIKKRQVEDLYPVKIEVI